MSPRAAEAKRGIVVNGPSSDGEARNAPKTLIGFMEEET